MPAAGTLRPGGGEAETALGGVPAPNCGEPLAGIPGAGQPEEIPA